MSNIERNLETIRNGVYGKDVRQAIHDAIEECYTDGHAGAVDLVARERINTLIGGTGDLVEVPLFEELELFAYDQTFTIDPDEYSISDFDYIAVYYKVVASGAPEVKWYTANDFLTLPVVISGVFLENAGHKLSAREIHIRCTDTDDQTFEVYLANNWKLNGSDAADGGTYTEVEATDEEKAGIISMISGIKFAPSAEVADIRVGEDGTTYASAGEAVRTQISDVKSQINAMGGGVPTSVRQAIYAILDNVGYGVSDDYNDELATILSWAQTVTVLTLSAETLSLSGNTPQTLTASTTPAGGVVSWESSDPAVATVNNGVVTGASNGSCTITARCGDVYAICAVTVSGIVTYTITNTLTHVTSNNNATSAGANTPYTATLTAESGYTILTVTVTMGGDDITSTAYSNGVITISAVTGNVVITATASDTIIYHLANAVFTGDSNERIDTGVKPLSVDRDFTIAFELTRDGTYTHNSYIFQCIEYSSPYWGAKFQLYNATYEAILLGQTERLSNYSAAYTGPLMVVIRHTANATSCEVKLRTTGAVGTYTVGSSIKTITSNLYMGGNSYKGTIKSFTWYSYRFSDDETNAFLGVS